MRGELSDTARNSCTYTSHSTSKVTDIAIFIIPESTQATTLVCKTQTSPVPSIHFHIIFFRGDGKFGIREAVDLADILSILSNSRNQI